MIPAIVGAGLAIGGAIAQKNQNKKAQERQLKQQRELNEQGQELGMKTWRETNYRPQVEELRKAGLSTGLMYEGGGAGGTVASGSGGQATQEVPTDFSGVAGMGIQGAMAGAQMDLIKAQTNKTNVEAQNIGNGGVDNLNTQADTSLKTMQAENQKLLNSITTETREDVVGTITANYNKAEGEAATAISEGRMSKERVDLEMKKLKQEGLNAVLQGEAIKAGTKLTAEQTRKIGEDLAQGWEQLYQTARSNDTQKGMLNIAGFKAKLDEILGKANVDLRAKELMLRGAETFIGGIRGGKSKGSTTETYNEGTGNTVIRHTTNH